MKELQGRIALVTGASRGLGKGIATALSRRGAEVIINYPPFEDRPEELEGVIRSEGGLVSSVEADVSNPESVDRLFDTIEQQYGRLDILVNNAGTSQAVDIFDTAVSDWHRIIDTNLSSGFYCAKRAMEIMRRQQYGRIVFISSVAAQRGALYGHVHYAASKSGQLGMVKTLARTGAPLGINVNAVAPGIIETELLRRTHHEGEIRDLSAAIPLGLGSPEDIGSAVAFLCGPEARYITGTTLDVNGGMNLR